MYKIEFSKRALSDLQKMEKNFPSLMKKIMALLSEISEHPRTGTGRVEQLRWAGGEVWSRRIDKKHRLVYEIFEEEVVVLIISTYGHYDDK